MTNRIWGGRFASGSRRDHGGDQRLDRVRPQALRAGYCCAPKPTPKCWRPRNHQPAKTAENISRGLDTIPREIENGRSIFKRALEDIHMNIEARLAELIGTAASRLHTARSRNDQVATDLRLWVRDAIDRLDCQAGRLPAGAGREALEHAATIMPGFTHLQSAQPVTFGHHLLAYVEMAARDRGRLSDARRRLTSRRWAPRRWPAPPFRSIA